MNKKTVQLISVAVVGFIALTLQLAEQQQGRKPATSTPRPQQVEESRPELAPPPSSAGDQLIASAFAARQSNVQVQGQGTVSRVLPDDNSGSRHQRFILQLANGITLLVAHNIDLAPRIAALQPGDTVGYFGEYEWSDKGGVLHWTHRDPAGRHAPGWLSHNGHFYQ